MRLAPVLIPLLAAGSFAAIAARRSAEVPPDLAETIEETLIEMGIDPSTAIIGDAKAWTADGPMAYPWIPSQGEDGEVTWTFSEELNEKFTDPANWTSLVVQDKEDGEGQDQGEGVEVIGPNPGGEKRITSFAIWRGQ